MSEKTSMTPDERIARIQEIADELDEMLIAGDSFMLITCVEREDGINSNTRSAVSCGHLPLLEQSFGASVQNILNKAGPNDLMDYSRRKQYLSENEGDVQDEETTIREYRRPSSDAMREVELIMERVAHEFTKGDDKDQDFIQNSAIEIKAKLRALDPDEKREILMKIIKEKIITKD